MRSHWSLESVMIEGISRHCPVCASNRQPWYVHSTVCPSQCPAESGNARCGHTSRSAKALPAASRPRTSGTSSRVEVASARSRSSSLRSAGYQKPHSNSPSPFEAVTSGIDMGWFVVMRNSRPIIYRSLVLAMLCGLNWQGPVSDEAVSGSVEILDENVGFVRRAAPNFACKLRRKSPRLKTRATTTRARIEDVNRTNEAPGITRNALATPKQLGSCLVSQFLKVRVIHEHRVPS